MSLSPILEPGYMIFDDTRSDENFVAHRTSPRDSTNTICLADILSPELNSMFELTNALESRLVHVKFKGNVICNIKYYHKAADDRKFVVSTVNWLKNLINASSVCDVLVNAEKLNEILREYAAYCAKLTELTSNLHDKLLITAL